MTDQIHRDPPFNKEYNALYDLSKAKQNLDTKDDIDEAEIEKHTMTRRSALLHD